MHLVGRFKLKSIKEFKRILIIGSPGSGKTTFSKKLGELLEIPIYHLDDFYWFENWQRIAPTEWELTLHSLCNQSSWIIDGNHFKTLDIRLSYADLVILLDYPTRVCFKSFFLRSIQRYFGINKDTLPVRIKSDLNYQPKFKIQWHLVKLVLFFKQATRPRIQGLAKKHSVEIITLLSRKKSQVFLEKQR